MLLTDPTLSNQEHEKTFYNQPRKAVKTTIQNVTSMDLIFNND